MTEIKNTDWAYDIESYLDFFCAVFVHIKTGQRNIFEISDRNNQTPELYNFIRALQSAQHRLFGYFNVQYDWPVVDNIIHTHERGYFVTGQSVNQFSRSIFVTESRWSHVVWPDQCIVPQGDLALIHHFDNVARATRLKELEVAMRSDNVVDLPFEPDQPTDSFMRDEIIKYCCHDVNETFKFYLHSLDQINFRDDLANKYPDLGDVLNYNDTKIGKKFFEMRLEQQGTSCYYYPEGGGKKRPRQTERDAIPVSEILSPLLFFSTSEFGSVYEWFKRLTVFGYNTNNAFKHSVDVDGVTYDYGTGGIHASVSKTVAKECDEWEIWDWDVASYYPNIAIKGRLYPQHLSEAFCDIYEDMFNTRKTYPKGTAENAMYKLALNGVYGDSNNVYSPFYDPQYTMSVTINGQLFLSMLIEWLTYPNGVKNNNIEVLQANTDGFTIKVRKKCVDWMKNVCALWEGHTGFELESMQYSSMFIRDVNNYLAVSKGGYVKRKGAYMSETNHDKKNTRELQWHQKQSMLVVAKAAEAFMVHGTHIEDFIFNHKVKWDFIKRIKVSRSHTLYCGDEVMQGVTRYVVTKNGNHLKKHMPPTPKMVRAGNNRDRVNSVEAGWRVTPVNDIKDFNWNDVNYLYYIEEAKKLVIQEK